MSTYLTHTTLFQTLLMSHTSSEYCRCGSYLMFSTILCMIMLLNKVRNSFSTIA